jgi:hypothetical protein
LPGVEPLGPRAVTASQQCRQAVAQELIVLTQEPDRFFPLRQDAVLLGNDLVLPGDGGVAVGDHALQDRRVIGKISEGRIIHDDDRRYVLSAGAQVKSSSIN